MIYFLVTKKFPIYNSSIPEPKNVLIASFGSSTIGSPLILKLVFKTKGILVIE